MYKDPHCSACRPMSTKLISFLSHSNTVLTGAQYQYNTYLNILIYLDSEVLLSK